MSSFRTIQTIYTPLKRDFQQQDVMLRQGQKEALIKLSCKSPIKVFPFAIYEGMEDYSESNKVLRICIPGVITQAKRDYLGLFKILQENSEVFRNQIDLYLYQFKWYERQIEHLE